MKSQLVPAVSPEGRTRYLVYLGRELYMDHSQENLEDQKGVVTSHMDKTWKSFWAEGIACTKAQRSPWNSGKARIPVCSTGSDCQYTDPHCYFSSTRSDWRPEGRGSVRHVWSQCATLKRKEPQLSSCCHLQFKISGIFCCLSP